VQGAPGNKLTLASGFNASQSGGLATLAVDPNQFSAHSCTHTQVCGKDNFSAHPGPTALIGRFLRWSSAALPVAAGSPIAEGKCVADLLGGGLSIYVAALLCSETQQLVRPHRCRVAGPCADQESKLLQAA
jgi:hypothetical protein